MNKKTYDKPQIKAVELKPVTLICTSPLNNVTVNTSETMDTSEDFE